MSTEAATDSLSRTGGPAWALFPLPPTVSAAAAQRLATTWLLGIDPEAPIWRDMSLEALAAMRRYDARRVLRASSQILAALEAETARKAAQAPITPPSRREKVEDNAALAWRELAWFAADGLELRLGWFVYDLAGHGTYKWLLAQGVPEPQQLAVCELCRRVVPSPKRRHICEQCAHNPRVAARAQRAASRGGRLEPEFDEGDRISAWVEHYLYECAACGRRCHDAKRSGRRRLLCRNCSRGEPRGPFLFTGANSVSFIRCDGTTCHLIANGGVIQTADAEDANYMRAHFPLDESPKPIRAESGGFRHWNGASAQTAGDLGDGGSCAATLAADGNARSVFGHGAPRSAA